MDKQRLTDLLLTVDEDCFLAVYDPDEAKASSLVSRRYDEMVGAFTRLREGHVR